MKSVRSRCCLLQILCRHLCRLHVCVCVCDCVCVCVCAMACVCVSDECWRIGVVICLGRDGRPSGDCFVRFRESVDMEKGLKKDRATMQRRYYSFFSSPAPQIHCTA